MNKNYGLFGLGLETGSAAASAPTTTFPASDDSDGIDVTVNTESISLTTGGRDTTAARYITGTEGTASVKTVCFPGAIGQLLYAALGKDTVSGNAAPYTHKITMGEALRPFTFFQQVGSSSAALQQLSGCKMSKLSLSASGTTPPSVEVELAGCKANWLSIKTWNGPDFDVDEGWFVTAGAKVLFSLTSGTPGAIPTGVVLNELSLEVENNVEGTQALGSVDTSLQTEGATDVTCSISGTADSTDFYRQVKTGSSTGTDVAGTIVTGSLKVTFPHSSNKNLTMVVIVPEIPWTIDAMGVSTDGGPFDLTLSTDGAIVLDGTSIEFDVQNSVASYEK